VASYKILWKSSAKKELKRLPKKEFGNILSAIESLLNDLHPTGSKKIVGTEHTYRQRVGNYRIVYSIESNYLIIGQTQNRSATLYGGKVLPWENITVI